MKTNRLVPIFVFSTAVLSGCASAPNTALEEARTSYATTERDPQVARLAPAELRQANDALNRADAAMKKDEDAAAVNHLAYLAKQRVAIAQEVANQKAAEENVANAGAERNKILLGVRTEEATAAVARAEAAQAKAEAERAKAEGAQKQAEASQKQAEASQQQAAASQQQATDAQKRQQELDAQLKELQAKATERGLVITLGNVLFDTNGTEIKPGGMRSVQKLADALKNYPERKILIEGFTDSTGADAYNRELSSRRAESVRAALQDMGVSPDRVTARGYGKQFPVAGNETPSGRQLNRRVEIIISDETGRIAPR